MLGPSDSGAAVLLDGARVTVTGVDVDTMTGRGPVDRDAPQSATRRSSSAPATPASRPPRTGRLGRHNRRRDRRAARDPRESRDEFPWAEAPRSVRLEARPSRRRFEPRQGTAVVGSARGGRGSRRGRDGPRRRRRTSGSRCRRAGRPRGGSRRRAGGRPSAGSSAGTRRAGSCRRARRRRRLRRGLAVPRDPRSRRAERARIPRRGSSTAEWFSKPAIMPSRTRPLTSPTKRWSVRVATVGNTRPPGSTCRRRP